MLINSGQYNISCLSNSWAKQHMYASVCCVNFSVCLRLTSNLSESIPPINLFLHDPNTNELACIDIFCLFFFCFCLAHWRGKKSNVFILFADAMSGGTIMKLQCCLWSWLNLISIQPKKDRFDTNETKNQFPCKCEREKNVHKQMNNVHWFDCWQ